MCHNTTAFFVKKPPQNLKFNDRNFDLTNIKVINASSGITQLDSLLHTLLLYCLKKLLFVLNSQFEMLFTTQVCKNEKKMFSKKGLYEYDAVNENIFNFTNCTNPVAPIKNANLLGHWSKKSTSWQWCNFTWKTQQIFAKHLQNFKVFKNWVVVQPSWFQNGWRQMTHVNPKKGKFRSHFTWNVLVISNGGFIRHTLALKCFQLDSDTNFLENSVWFFFHSHRKIVRQGSQAGSGLWRT